MENFIYITFPLKSINEYYKNTVDYCKNNNMDFSLETIKNTIINKPIIYNNNCVGYISNVSISKYSQEILCTGLLYYNYYIEFIERSGKIEIESISIEKE